MAMKREPGGIERLSHAFPALAREGAYIRGEVELLGPGLRCERCELALRGTVANDEAAAELAQRPVEVGQTFEQELRRWAGRVTAVE